LPERTAFVKSILRSNPKRIVDLGCGPALWLDLFNSLAPADCELIGIDIDDRAIHLAKQRAANWTRSTVFKELDIENASNEIPEADVFLAFNLFPYLSDASRLLNELRTHVRGAGIVAVRQYDGSLFRIGPMPLATRTLIDLSLQASVIGSEQFRHYDLDRVFTALESSQFKMRHIDFELFRRVAPYPPDFMDYLKNSIDWMTALVSDEARAALTLWHDSYAKPGSQVPSYFVEVDLVAWLS
jgi:SAM-dependent methyltransferase